MIKHLRHTGLILSLTALLFGIIGVESVQATPALHTGSVSALVMRNDISQNTVHSTAYRVGNGDNTRFYGTLQAKTYAGHEYCYEMQYQVADGSWLDGAGSTGNDGFWISENISENPLIHCSNEIAPYRSWSIHAGLTVRGIRFTNGVNTGTHCGPLSATECRALTAP